jgi:hypothetical protein
VTSGVLAGVGIPLFAVGAKIKPDQEPVVAGHPAVPQFPGDPAAEPKMRSQPMMIAGGVLIGMGGLHAVAATTVIGLDAAEGSGFGIFLVGIPLFVDSLILTSIGIPLLAVGSSREQRGYAAASQLIPTITAGPGGIQTTWSLP